MISPRPRQILDKALPAPDYPQVARGMPRLHDNSAEPAPPASTQAAPCSTVAKARSIAPACAEQAAGFSMAIRQYCGVRPKKNALFAGAEGPRVLGGARRALS